GGASRRDVGLSAAGFTRPAEPRHPVNEFNAGASAISFRTASTIRSNSTSLIARSIAPGPAFCRQDDKRDRAEHRSPCKFVVWRLARGRFDGKKRSKSGTAGPHLAEPVASVTRPAPSLGPTCPMRARFGHESGEFA